MPLEAGELRVKNEGTEVLCEIVRVLERVKIWWLRHREVGGVGELRLKSVVDMVGLIDCKLGI